METNIVPDYEFKFCKFKVEGPVATFMWSDPPVRNAYNVRAWEGFNQAVDRVFEDDDIRVLVLTGDPEGKNFCGGLNVKAYFDTQLQRAGKDDERQKKEGALSSQRYFMEAELTPGTPEYKRRQQGLVPGGTWDARHVLRDFPIQEEGMTQGRMRYEGWRRHGGAQHAFRLMELDKPVIAMINGPAFGAGCDMIFCCDIIVASEENAKFEWTYIRRGMVSPDGGTYFLPRIVGRHIALELLWRGRAISARQAYEWGLINHIVPHAELEKFTYDLANELATNVPPMIMGVIKDVVHKGYHDFIHNFKDHFEYLVGVGNLIYRGSEDELEGSRAFVEKRPPKYKFR